jgi:hypothetical protein
MDSWHATFLGRRHLPREVTAFEVEVFFQFSAEEARIIEERRRPELKLGLALQIGFLRMSGRLLDAVRMVPPLLWRHLGARFGVAAPDLASLRAMYRRAPTLIEHQQLACDALGFQWLTGHHRRALVRVLRQELDRTDDRERLLGFARSWLYEHRLIIVHERLLRSMIAAARREHEAQLARRIDHAVEPGLMIQWCGAITAPHGSGSSLQTWLWAPPAKHSSRQIEEMVERIECLYALRVHKRMGDFPDDLLRRHARRLAGRPPSAGALIQEPGRSIETACFLRYCLLTATDRLLMMVRRQVADLWRRAAIGATATQGDWALLYQELLAALGAIVAEPAAGDEGILGQLHSLLTTHRTRRPVSRAQLVRERLIDGVRPVRSLLNALVRLPWQATASKRCAPYKISTPTSSAICPPVPGYSSAESGWKSSTTLTANALSVPSRWRLCWLCDAPYATGRYGSITALPSAAASGSSSPPIVGRRSAAPTFADWVYQPIRPCFLRPSRIVPRLAWQRWRPPHRPARFASTTSCTSHRSPRRRRIRKLPSCASLSIGGSGKRSFRS